MISTTIGRLVWREYRVTRGLWISLWLVTLLMFLSPLVLRELQSIIYRDFHIGWAIILCMPLIYLVGTIATAFNREHENGTYAMLRQSPATPTQIATAKIGFSIASALLLLVAMTASFLAIRSLGWMPPLIRSTNPMETSLSPSIMTQWLLYLGLIVGTSTISSVYVRQPLVAVGVAGVAPLFTLLTANIVSLSNVQTGWTFQLEPLGQLLLGVFDFLLLSVAGQVALGWLEEKQLPPFRFRSAKVSSIEVPVALSSGVRSISLRRHLSRVLWIDRWKYLVYLVFAIVLGQLTLGLSIICLLVFSAVLGGTLFAYEQSSNHKHFLVERGVSGLRVWTLRQMIGCTLILVALASCGTVHPIGPFLTFLLPLYAATHLCSLLFKSRIHAIVSAFLISGLGAFVLHFLWVRMHMPFWLISLLPFVGLLLVGVNRANHWLIDRNRWRDWIVPGAVLASLGPIWLVVANVFRANELPVVSALVIPETPSVVPLTEAEKLVRQTIELISMRNVNAKETSIPVDQLMRPHAVGEFEWTEEHAGLLNPSLHEAINQLDSIDYDVHKLVALLVTDARHHQLAKRFDESLRDYRSAMQLCVAYRRSGNLVAFANSRLETMVIQNALLWAACPGQSKERIEQLLDDFEKSWAIDAPWTLMATKEYRWQLNALRNAGGATDEFAPQSPLSRFLERAIMSQPGEKIRAERWLDREYAEAYARLEASGADIAWDDRIYDFASGTQGPAEAGLIVPPQVVGMRSVMAQMPACQLRRTERELTRWALRVIQANVNWSDAQDQVPIGTDRIYVYKNSEPTELRFELPLMRAVVDMSGHYTLVGTHTFFLPPLSK